MTKYVDVRFVFDEETGDDYTYYNIAEAQYLGGDLPPGGREDVAESLGQSDFAYIELPHAIILAIEGNNTDFRGRSRA